MTENYQQILECKALNDTDPLQTEIYRRMTSAERIQKGCQLHDFAHKLLISQLEEQNPGLSRSAILVIAARRFLGDAARVL